MSQSLIASASVDGHLKVWKEVQQGKWQCLYRHQATSAVQSVCFAPSEYGILITCGCQDGSLNLLEYSASKQEWLEPVVLQAHDAPVTSISWAPGTEPCLLKAEKIDFNSE